MRGVPTPAQGKVDVALIKAKGPRGDQVRPSEEGEEEGMPDIDTGEGEDEVHIDVDSHNDGEEEEGGEEEEEEMPKKKKKPPFDKGD